MHKQLFFRAVTLFGILSIWGCVPLDQASTSVNSSSTPKQLQLRDHIYEENIKTVRLYPIQNSYDEVIQPAVLSIHSQRNLILEFDQLFGDFQSYYVRLIHCNSNWEKSRLNDAEFLAQFNEFPNVIGNIFIKSPGFLIAMIS